MQNPVDTPPAPAHIPRPRPLRWWRNAALLYAVALLIWFSLEDNQTLPVVIFGLLMALLWGWRAPALSLITHHSSLITILLGGLVGAGAAVAAAALMFFKTAWHAHLYPDYPPGMMLAMLSRAPAWALVGALLALAWVLGKMVLAPQKRTPLTQTESE